VNSPVDKNVAKSQSTREYYSYFEKPDEPLESEDNK
jgi:hypothetical protein